MNSTELGSLDLAEHYLADTRSRMQELEQLGDRSLEQLLPDQWHTPLSSDGNSAAVLIQHLAGNMHSRWGAFRSGFASGAEGETASRNRDAEFEGGGQAAEELRQKWEQGWHVFFDALDALTASDLGRTFTIRAEPHTVLQAIQRQVMHYSGHVYQLIFLVKTLRGNEFQTLSIPRGGSAAYNAQKMSEQH